MCQDAFPQLTEKLEHKLWTAGWNRWATGRALPHDLHARKREVRRDNLYALTARLLMDICGVSRRKVELK